MIVGCIPSGGLSLIKFDQSSIRVHPKVVAFYRKYATLKYLIIDDKGENVDVKTKILKLLKNNIPSSQQPKRKRRRNVKTEEKKSYKEAKIDVNFD